MAGNPVVGWGLFLSATLIAFVVLNIAVEKSNVLGGISLTEALADEFRIRFMSPPEKARVCFENMTHMIAGCEDYFYGSTVRIPQTEVRINSLGFRGDEYPPEKGNGTYRIFTLGDSFTFGEGVDEEETYAYIIEQNLSSLQNDKAYEVFNLGLPGASTDMEYRRLLTYMRYLPDLIILQTLENDAFECESLRERMDAALGISDERVMNLPLKEKVGLRREWERLREEYVSRLDLDGRCSCVKDSLWDIINLADENRIPLIIYDMTGEQDETCFNVVSTETISYYRSTGVAGKREYWISRDDPHPDGAGHRKIAEELMPLILRYALGNESLQKI